MERLPADSATTPDTVLRRFLGDLGEDHRPLAPGEWGLTLDCAGWPLHVGLSVRGGLLRAQAEVVGPGQLDPAELLQRNRRGVLVRYAQTRAGAVWIHGELPEAALEYAELDRLLGLLVEAASWARYAVSGAAASSPPSRRA